MSISGELETFVLCNLTFHLDRSVDSISHDEDLIEAGVVDSLGLLKLTAFIEATFGIKINDDDLVPENFRSIASVQKLIEAKLA